MKAIKNLRKKKQKSSNTRLIIEYLIVFQKSGLPIFSKCFGDFCGVLLVDETLLSGFLSAMTSMPTFFAEGKAGDLNAVEMGFTKLLFSHTLPSGHVICLGFNKKTITEENQKRIDVLFEKINSFIEQDNATIDWSLQSSEEIKVIVNTLLEKIIDPWIHVSEVYSNEHIAVCPICIDGSIFRGEHDEGIKQPIWKRLGDIYAYGRHFFKDDIPKKRQMFVEKGEL